ncbi:hypothetical protein [uncultured Gemella sp.]|uniref:hypothetical protein n=1 Tax=uncultured Gemella sp. TaxID=254352 RepID=UPI0028E47B40|nr:hypothetical protein [uncultured Gemella sp.]
MKNTTLLKVLSASAIFTAIAAIESYDHNAFATEVTATATDNQSDVETKKVPQDVKNLADGTYNITSEALNFSEEGRGSMAAGALDKEKTKLVVNNGQYSVNVTFKPIDKFGLKGYLGDLKYYDGDKTHANRSEIKDSDFKDTTIIENYSENEKDDFVNVYKKKFPGRTVYPKTFSYNVDKNKIDANNKLETFTQVFVPVMESIVSGAGTQRMILKYDLSSLATKTITVPKVDTKKLAKEKAEKERLEKEKPIVTAKGEAAILKVTEFDLEGYIKNHQGPITAKGEAAILDKPEFDLEEYIRSQKGSVGKVPSNAKVPYNSKEEFTNKNKENADFKDSTDVKDSQDKKETTSTPKPLINDIFGQSEVKDTFVATPVSNKENTKNTLDIKKSLANTGTTAATTGFFGLITLLTAFVLRRKVNK